MSIAYTPYTSHIRDIYIQCVSQNVPCISPATQEFLTAYILKHRPTRVCEVWCAIWYSTAVIADTISLYTQDFHIDSFDISYPHYHQAIHNIYPWRHNISLYHANFLDSKIDRLIQGTYDLLYIDGRKSEYLAYMHHLSFCTWPLTRIILDDVLKYKSKMNDLYDYVKNPTISHTLYKIEWDDWLMEIYGLVTS